MGAVFAAEIRIPELLHMTDALLNRHGRPVVTPSDFTCMTTSFTLSKICLAFSDNTSFYLSLSKITEWVKHLKICETTTLKLFNADYLMAVKRTGFQQLLNSWSINCCHLPVTMNAVFSTRHFVRVTLKVTWLFICIYYISIPSLLVLLSVFPPNDLSCKVR